jgi:hypothetical protein
MPSEVEVYERERMQHAFRVVCMPQPRAVNTAPMLTMRSTAQCTMTHITIGSKVT